MRKALGLTASVLLAVAGCTPGSSPQPQPSVASRPAPASSAGSPRWGYAHNSALIVTFDENDGTAGNRILTLVYGERTIPGRYSQALNHYNLLATLESWYGLARLNHTAGAAVLPNAWH